jgi:FolB domain-containing protein
MDRILISDLLVRCIIGVRAEERKEKQDVLINLSLFADLRKAGKSDLLEDSVDYSAVKKRILNMAEFSQFYLVEALAEAAAEICLEQRAVSRVQVRVEKPSALRFARSVGVEITRERKKWPWRGRS